MSKNSPFPSDMEAIFLQAILDQGNDAYGIMIQEKAQENSGRSIGSGTLYTTLRRMQSKGFVESNWGEDIDNIGARRKYYKITGLGQKALLAYKELSNTIFISGQIPQSM